MFQPPESYGVSNNNCMLWPLSVKGAWVLPIEHYPCGWGFFCGHSATDFSVRVPYCLCSFGPMPDWLAVVQGGNPSHVFCIRGVVPTTRESLKVSIAIAAHFAHSAVPPFQDHDTQGLKVKKSWIPLFDPLDQRESHPGDFEIAQVVPRRHMDSPHMQVHSNSQ